MKVAVFLSISILLWSLYPLLSILVLRDIDAFSFMLAVQFIAFHGAVVMAIISLARRGQISQYLRLQRDIGMDGVFILCICGACSAFGHILFLLALDMANKNGISLIIEIWPILAVFFAPHFIDKRWENSGKSDYIVGLVAFSGIAMIILSDENINWFRNETWELETLLAYGMTIVACYMTAMLNLLRAQYSQKLKPLNNSFASVMIAESATRFIAVALILLAIFGMQLELQSPLSQIGLISVIGIGIFALGGGALTYAIMCAKNPNVSLFFYMVPLLSVVWLIAVGVTQFTPIILIGGIITTVACMYLAYDKKYGAKRETSKPFENV